MVEDDSQAKGFTLEKDNPELAMSTNVMSCLRAADVFGHLFT